MENFSKGLMCLSTSEIIHKSNVDLCIISTRTKTHLTLQKNTPDEATRLDPECRNVGS